MLVPDWHVWHVTKESDPQLLQLVLSAIQLQITPLPPQAEAAGDSYNNFPRSQIQLVAMKLHYIGVRLEPVASPRREFPR